MLFRSLLPSLYLKDDLAYVLKKREKYIVPLQQLDHKVCLAIKGAGEGIGFSNLGEKEMMIFGVILDIIAASFIEFPVSSEVCFIFRIFNVVHVFPDFLLCTCYIPDTCLTDRKLHRKSRRIQSTGLQFEARNELPSVSYRIRRFR